MYGPVKIVVAGKREIKERGMTASEVLVRDSARVARDLDGTALDAKKQKRADDIAALKDATLEEMRAILVRVLR